ncbi:MAG TPA: hypothetical protein VML94_06560 [Thermoplasmata archaeon]|nr:hypothetical protein [Thermoplasmata archaeon]
MVTASPSVPLPPSGRGPPIEQRGAVRCDSLDAERWTVRGAAKVLRDATVGAADLRGTVTVGGAVRAVRLDGTVHLGVVGDVRVQDAIRLQGELRVNGALSAGQATIRGGLLVGGAVTIERRLEVVGPIGAASLRAAEFVARGRTEIPGVVGAGAVDLRPGDRSRLGTVEARTVRIVAPVPNPVEALLGHHVSVGIDRVEADTVELSGVDVGFVHARELVLGPGSHVATVEGTVVRRHPTARVGPESRTPPPHGLWR